MDRIVYSDSEKIKVTSGQFSHEPISKDMGILIWKIPLKNIKDLTLHYEYEVIYEKDVTITPPLP